MVNPSAVASTSQDAAGAGAVESASSNTAVVAAVVSSPSNVIGPMQDPIAYKKGKFNYLATNI